jgi:uncharacterized protein (TIGR03435 family)
MNRILSAAVLVSTVQFLAGPVAAQTLEVATIKVNHTGSGGSGFPGLRNGTLTARNVSLKTLLQAAYGLPSERIVGPDWIDSDKFDLSGKAPRETSEADFRTMLQSLLNERFQVLVHQEVRQMPVYDMWISKSGLKMKVYDPDHPPVPPRTPGGAMVVGSGTMAQLANRLAAFAGRPVIDRSGLTERYSFTLIFTPLSARPLARLYYGAGPKRT